MYHHHGLGSAFDSYEKYFDGSVDDVRMYSGVLSATEIETLYNAYKDKWF